MTGEGGALEPTVQGRVYIILVNWNGWRDTVECLESVYRLTNATYTVIVCDNASGDGSVDNIAKWAEGELETSPRDRGMAAFTSPPVTKPLRYIERDRQSPVFTFPGDVRLILMRGGVNLGFAGACNLGMRVALAQPDASYLWFLNNDTVVRPDALSSLIDRMSQEPKAGLCGSTLLFYDDPEHIQACGGSRYNPWTSRGGHIAAGWEASRLPGRDWVEGRLAYIVGASLLVSRSFAETIGVMNEKYFLYFEEVDWARRAKGRFSLAYAPRSVVYHKVGATIGSAARSVWQSELADFWGTRNRVAFTRNHYWYALPTVYSFVIASVLLRLVHGRVKNALAVLRGAFQGTVPSKWDVTHGLTDDGALRGSSE